MPRRHSFSSGEKRAITYIVAGAAINGAVIDPLLGNWTYNNPSVPKSPLEPWITTADGIQLAINGLVFGIGVVRDSQPLLWLGTGMIAEKLGEKMTLWVWNYLHPGKPTW